jgi:hypothetical protein
MRMENPGWGKAFLDAIETYVNRACLPSRNYSRLSFYVNVQSLDLRLHVTAFLTPPSIPALFANRFLQYL